MKKGILFIALLIFALGIVGNGDLEDEIARVDHYCKQVKAKLWPDYDKNIDCKRREND